MTKINLHYIETVCNSYQDIGKERICWVLHNMAENIIEIDIAITRLIWILIISMAILFYKMR